MKRKKGGRDSDRYGNNSHKRGKSKFDHVPKNYFRVAQAILELLYDYFLDDARGIAIERVANKIRHSLPFDSLMSKSEIEWYVKTAILDLEASGEIERYHYREYEYDFEGNLLRKRKIRKIYGIGEIRLTQFATRIE